MSRPQIRIRATDDLELVADLDRQAFNGHCLLQEYELNRAVWWVAEMKQADWEPVGYAGAELVDGVLVLTRAGVLPVARGAGLQRRLIAVRERWGRSRGAAVAQTYTHWANIQSQRSLVRCGYLPSRYWVEDDGKIGARFLDFKKNLASKG
jgi:GNAT superfamily N-acetyltransferase